MGYHRFEEGGLMELLQMKYFQVVARNEHIARSSEELNVSQPAISLMIARLEQELGGRLFDRVGRRIVLNEYSAAFLRHVDKILREEENALLELEEMKRGNSQSISIAMTSPHLLDGIILPFIALHPRVRWKIRVADVRQCVNLMQGGAVDFCISAPGVWGSGIETSVCVEDSIVVVSSAEHPFTRLESVTLEEIAGERIIMLVGDYAFRRHVDKIFSRYGVRLNYFVECPHLLRNELLRANQGISISLSSAQRRKLYGEEVRYIPIRQEGLPTVPIVIARMKDRYRTNICEEFIQYINDFYRGVRSGP